VHLRLANGRELVAKRALPQLKTASEWRVSTDRNHNEAAWLRRAGAIVPGAVPAVLGEDQARGIVLLEYLPPSSFTLWKDDLLAGRIDAAVAVAVADTIGRIHAATLGAPAVAAEFATDGLFDALRLDPYLRATAARHPAVAGRILAALTETARNHVALVHGDLSPKNILVSRADGHPVILDAECAWYGDPAFDAAFCLNHLLLKAIHMPSHAAMLSAAADAFQDRWLSHFPADLRNGLAERTARLLPCLMLARVDGKSPVEYLSAMEQDRVRAVSLPLIRMAPSSLTQILERLPP